MSDARSAIQARLDARRWELRVKRSVDVTVAFGLLLLLSPVLVAAALCVALESRGPVLFSQPRWGLNGRVFSCHKFRSMRATRATADPSAEGSFATDGTLEKRQDDPRITRVGRMLRRTSIDELPQLWNVLVGEMSLVGPRPLMLHMLEPYPELRELRCALRPGLTGLWQVRDRVHNTHVFAMMDHDTEYLCTVSLWLDARILARTLPVVLGGWGAV